MRTDASKTVREAYRGQPELSGAHRYVRHDNKEEASRCLK
jgi:hypothetical protein